jgi:hypothetical protein
MVFVGLLMGFALAIGATLVQSVQASNQSPQMQPNSGLMDAQ